MNVFISWSGERSRAAAEALRAWLPKMINALKPWLSSADIEKGVRWTTDVASRLEKARAGIICLTPGNLHSDWILFEAGALSKTLDNTFVCPLLIGMDPADIEGPLAQFQATRAVKEDVLRLIKTLNSALTSEALAESHLEEAFEVWWPRLEAQLKALPAESSSVSPRRSDRELLEEVLALARQQTRLAPVFIPGQSEAQVVAQEIERVTQCKVAGWSWARNENQIHWNFKTTEGKEASMVLPAETSLLEVAANAISQIQSSAITLNAEPTASLSVAAKVQGTP
jgi:TIR domain